MSNATFPQKLKTNGQLLRKDRCPAESMDVLANVSARI
jgi:hypothetical protein